jgi:hypothetical protein
VGAKATPRRTSPNFAVRSVTKWPRESALSSSPSPVGKVVAERRSVTFTSLLGSAPLISAGADGGGHGIDFYSTVTIDSAR